MCMHIDYESLLKVSRHSDCPTIGIYVWNRQSELQVQQDTAERACAHEEEIFCIMHLIASSNTFINKITKEDNAYI